MTSISKGPQGPRRSAQQARAAQKQRDIMQQMKDDEMSKKMQEAYEKSQSQSLSGMNKGGKVRRFNEGGKVPGMTSYAESGSAGGSNISFKDAFREARKSGLDEFTWRGKKYTTELKEKKKPKEEEKTAARKVSTEEFAANMNARLGSEDKILPDSFMPRQTKYPKLEPRSKAAKTDKDTAREMYSGLSKYEDSDSVYENLAKGRKRGYRADPNYNKGGSVKKYARGGGIEIRGKTRGRFV
jgi:hypothetical protein